MAAADALSLIASASAASSTSSPRAVLISTAVGFISLRRVASIDGASGRSRDVPGDDVSRAEQLIDREQADVHFAGTLGRQVRIVTD